jgi:putative transposase
MMEQAVEELTPIVGTRAACQALGVAPATIYRRRRPPQPQRASKPRPPPARKLSPQEREAVLEELHAERFVDCSPAQIWATLLDEGRYLASERTMYRILDAEGETRERRDQLVHPPYTKPELLAERPNELWSWDITKLLGPAKWSYFYLYVILDVFSRYVVGLDRPASRVGLRGQAAHRPGHRSTGRRTRTAHDPRRPRNLHALQAGGVPAR